MAKFVRVREAGVGDASVSSHPLTGQFISFTPGTRYRADDPVVLAYPWRFVAEDALASGEDDGLIRPVDEVEKATAEPGRRRRMTRSGADPE